MVGNENTDRTNFTEEVRIAVEKRTKEIKYEKYRIYLGGFSYLIQPLTPKRNENKLRTPEND